jgi:hypothetical protein
MKENREMLRFRFYAETDVEIDPTITDWERYARWLENLAIKDINKEILKENKMLLNKMQEARDILERGITGARAK